MDDDRGKASGHNIDTTTYIPFRRYAEHRTHASMILVKLCLAFKKKKKQLKFLHFDTHHEFIIHVMRLFR